MKTVTMRAAISHDKCTGCGICAKVCPTLAVTVKNRKAVVAPERCLACANCHQRCPVEAVTLERLEKPFTVSTVVRDEDRASVDALCLKAGFNPSPILCYCTATRAEAATILRNLVEGVIDEATARGWAKNEAGQWMYWTWDGKLRTGWVNVTTGSRYYMDENGIMVAGKWVKIGGKWYYFYADGKLAVNTTIEGHAVGPDGSRKE